MSAESLQIEANELDRSKTPFRVVENGFAGRTQFIVVRTFDSTLQPTVGRLLQYHTEVRLCPFRSPFAAEAFTGHFFKHHKEKRPNYPIGTGLIVIDVSTKQDSPKLIGWRYRQLSCLEEISLLPQPEIMAQNQYGIPLGTDFVFIDLQL